jgi:hypothetical protein
MTWTPELGAPQVAAFLGPMTHPISQQLCAISHSVVANGHLIIGVANFHPFDFGCDQIWISLLAY